MYNFMSLGVEYGQTPEHKGSCRSSNGLVFLQFIYFIIFLKLVSVFDCFYTYISISAPMLLEFPSSIYAQKCFSCEL